MLVGPVVLAQPAKARLIMRGDTARRGGEKGWRMRAVYGQIARGV